MAYNLSNMSVIIATHSRATGFPQLLLTWLLPQVKEVLFIDHPLPGGSKTFSSMTLYKKNKKVKYTRSQNINVPLVFLFFKDFFFTIYYCLKTNKVYDIGIGVDNLNTAAFIVLKKLGRIKFVVYHTVDYTPHRFSNKLLNWVYHQIDRYACYNADMLWNSSKRMNEGRIKNGLDKKKIAPTIVTPDGSNFDHKKRLPIEKIDRYKVVFLGHLRNGMGLDSLISTASEIIKKVPKAHYLVIGDGPLLNQLRKKVRELKIDNRIKFTGFIKDHKEVDRLLRTGAVGLAPFELQKESIEYYSDVGKPKVYLAAGQPVVITKLPEIAYEIQKYKAGFAVSGDTKEVVNSIVSLLTNDELYRTYRKNAIQLGEKYKWNIIFDEAFNKTLPLLNKN